MNRKEIMDLINKARFLMFTLEHNSQFPAENLPQYREMIEIYVNDNRHALIQGNSSEFELLILETLVEDMTSVYERLPRALENDVKSFVVLGERLNNALSRVNLILENKEQLANLSNAAIEELEIYQNILSVGVDVILMSLELPSLSSRYSTLFLENRLQGLESWLDALGNQEVPDMMLVQIPMRNIEDREEVEATKEAEGNKEVEDVKEVVEGDSLGFIDSIVNCFIRGFNNLFVHQNAAVLPNQDYVVSYTGGAVDPAMAATELDQSAVNNLAGVSANCG
jgi:hypothetical protein